MHSPAVERSASEPVSTIVGPGAVLPSEDAALLSMRQRISGHFSTSYLWLNSVIIGLVLAGATGAGRDAIASYGSGHALALATALAMILVVLAGVVLVYAEVTFGSVLLARHAGVGEILVPGAVGLVQFSQVALVQASLPQSVAGPPPATVAGLATWYWFLAFGLFAALGFVQIWLIRRTLDATAWPTIAGLPTRDQPFSVYRQNLTKQFVETGAATGTAGIAAIADRIADGGWLALAFTCLFALLLIRRIIINEQSRRRIVGSISEGVSVLVGVVA